MESILEVIQHNVHLAPYLVFFSLILAGFNLPISEDAMLFISGVMAAHNPDHFIPLLLGVFLGAYFSDLICYWIGRKLGPKLWKSKFFANMVSHKTVDHIAVFYKKYGIITLLVGRFIPFGVRNALFLTAGLGKMNFFKFSMSDLVACTLSTSLFFPLYYYFGGTVINYVKKGNIILFFLAAIVVISIYLAKRGKSR
ncbi:MAG: DedA family protein [Bacteriovoracaceae bacterium]|nr:DedA family protein [Bacteriovoracaceae bacterium]